MISVLYLVSIKIYICKPLMHPFSYELLDTQISSTSLRTQLNLLLLTLLNMSCYGHITELTLAKENCSLPKVWITDRDGLHGSQICQSTLPKKHRMPAPLLLPTASTADRMAVKFFSTAFQFSLHSTILLWRKYLRFIFLNLCLLIEHSLVSCQSYNIKRNIIMTKNQALNPCGLWVGT